jgi:hypothetical protein
MFGPFVITRPEKGALIVRLVETPVKLDANEEARPGDGTLGLSNNEPLLAARPAVT